MPHSWFDCEFFLFIAVFRNRSAEVSISISENDNFTSRSCRIEIRSLKVSYSSIMHGLHNRR